MNTKIKTEVGLIIILAVFALSLILAQKATPNVPPLFALKRIQEKIFLNLKSDPQEKTDYMIFLLNNRLEELRQQVNAKNYDYILPSASRYSTLAGQITDLIIENNMTDKIDPIKQTFLKHQKLLNDLYVIYPKNTDNWEWKYIQDDYNYLKLYLDKLAKM